MDLSGCLGRLGAPGDGPGPHLVGACSEEGDQAQQGVAALDQAVQAGLLQPQLLQKHLLLLLVQLGDLLLGLGADGQHLAALGGGDLPDDAEVPVVLGMGNAAFVHVGGVDDGLQAQQVGFPDDGHFVRRAVIGPGGLALVQMLQQTLQHLRLTEIFLVAALGGLFGPVDAALDHLAVRQDQLQVDAFDVTGGVHGNSLAGVLHHVHDVVVIKAADHMDDGVGHADVAQELVAQARALGGALHQTGDVHELDDGGSVFFGIVQPGQIIQAAVGHGDHAHIGLDGAEGIVGAFRAGIGDGVEQGALAHIGQTHDT